MDGKKWEIMWKDYKQFGIAESHSQKEASDRARKTSRGQSGKGNKNGEAKGQPGGFQHGWCLVEMPIKTNIWLIQFGPFKVWGVFEASR